MHCIIRDVVFSILKPSKFNEHFWKKHGGVESRIDAETLKINELSMTEIKRFQKMEFTSVKNLVAS